MRLWLRVQVIGSAEELAAVVREARLLASVQHR